jgi:L-threonylcarbamoyladenylate synthase
MPKQVLSKKFITENILFPTGCNIIKINNKNHKEVIAQAANFIKNGKVVIFPTDTVYGLLADARNQKAVAKIFSIKKRNKKQYLPVFVKDTKMAEKFGQVEKQQKILLKKYWPGKITVVLKRKENIKLYGLDKKTIAIRIPKQKFLNTLLDKLNFPVVQTSANISGVLPITNAEDIFKQFKKNKPDLIIDGGELKTKSSKIIDLTIKPYKILRQ